MQNFTTLIIIILTTFAQESAIIMINCVAAFLAWHGSAPAARLQPRHARDASSHLWPAHRCWPLTMSAIEASEEQAVAQRESYFAMMPSKKLPTVSLDLRAFASTDDDASEAAAFARQASTVDDWKNIGTVSAGSDSDLTAAVARQRPLIERWAYEVCNDFETNELKMSLDDDAPPIEIAWAVRPPKPGFLDGLMGKKEEPIEQIVVPPDAAFAEDVRCGFLGVLAREYRGGGVSARYDRIVLGQLPQVPLRSASQAKYDDKYKKKKGKIAGTVGTKDDGRIIV